MTKWNLHQIWVLWEISSVKWATVQTYINDLLLGSFPEMNLTHWDQVIRFWLIFIVTLTLNFVQMEVSSQSTWWRIQWNGNVVILTKFSSLAALKVFILTTFSAASDENFVKMTTFPFWQLSVQPVAKILSKWWHFHFSVWKKFRVAFVNER